MVVPPYQKPARMKLVRWRDLYYKRYFKVDPLVIQVSNETFIFRAHLDAYLTRKIAYYKGNHSRLGAFWLDMSVKRRQFSCVSQDVDLNEWVPVASVLKGKANLYYSAVYRHVDAGLIRHKKVFGFKLYNREDLLRHKPNYET